jgi:hypothetical protein
MRSGRVRLREEVPVAANESGYPTPPDPSDPDHRRCPICAWSPCTSTCLLGLTASDVRRLEGMFTRGDRMPAEGEEDR